MAVHLPCVCLLGVAAPANGLAASWTSVTAPPQSPGVMLQLTDGSVMVVANSDQQTWMRLKPSASGDYAAGAWSLLAKMSTPRLYFASQVLPNGKVWVLGGEYSGSDLTKANWANSAEIYDPVTNSWSKAASFPESQFGDGISILLPNGTIMAGSSETTKTYIYDPATDHWSPGASKTSGASGYNDASDEESWILMPNGHVLTYDLFKTIDANNGHGYAESYDPVANAWSKVSPVDGTAAGALPVLSSGALGWELGPGLLLQDGRVLIIGANEHTALYSPAINSWAAGPDIIGTLRNEPAAFGADDAPGAILPNGHVIFAADAGPTLGIFKPPTQLFDFDPAGAGGAGAISPLATPVPDPHLPSLPAFVTRMLVLPTGQLLFGEPYQLFIYTPDGAPNPALRPVINHIAYTSPGVFTLTGKQLNGQSVGAAYGDDNQMNENYPIVRLVNASGVHYCRTTNWSKIAVGTSSALQTVNFTVPPGLAAGNYAAIVSGAGISSFPMSVYVPLAQASGL